MKCKWLFDSDMLKSSYHKNITEICDALGYEYEILKYIPHANAFGVDPFVDAPTFKESECVVAYGSIEFLNSIGYYNKSYIPTAYMQNEMLSCRTYLPHIPSEYLLNDEYIMLPYGEFKRRKEKVFDLFNTNKLFLRPDSGFKTFAGTTIHVDDFDYEINTLEKLTSVLDNTIILISKIKRIKKEFRIVVGDKKVIASSQYRSNDKLSMVEGAPDGALELAFKIVNLEWQPDLVYTVDVAELEDGTFKVIELNSFSAAGFYACNIEDIIKGISAIAEKEYYEIME